MKIYFTSFIILFAFLCFGQDEKTEYNYFIKTSYQSGYVFQTNYFLKGDNPEKEKINSMKSLSVRVGLQTFGKKYWEDQYDNPQYGFQFKIVDFGEPDFIGTPIVVSGFFTAPLLKTERLTFAYDVGLGAAFNWKPFNPISNNQNLSIGARQSFYFDLGFILAYDISKRFTVETGLNLSHYSNGALKLPNYGINIVAPKLGTVKGHPLQSKRDIVYTYETYNLNINTDYYALESNNNYGTKIRIYQCMANSETHHHRIM